MSLSNSVVSTPLAVVLKGYPRLSETFIAQELLELQRRGIAFTIVSMRFPTDRATHRLHQAIRAPLLYLPEYLYQEPVRLARAWWRARRMPGYRHARATWLRDLRRDLTPNRGRRFGQALVLAAELGAEVRHLHAHFLHTPASVTRYAALMAGLPWSVSAHAKDIWTSPDWEKREKLAEARWAVTCTRSGAEHLAALAPGKVDLVYHGLDLARFPAPPPSREPRDGTRPDAPLRLLSVGRAVRKKGFDVLLRALARLPEDLHWRWTHIGGGAETVRLRDLAKSLGLDGRTDWLGAKDQDAVIAACREADLFVLASRIAADGDRDGLPNVLMEAATQELCCLSTAVSAIPEFIDHGENGWLVPADDDDALAEALILLAQDPARRLELGRRAGRVVRERFSHEAGINRLIEFFDPETFPRATRDAAE